MRCPQCGQDVEFKDGLCPYCEWDLDSKKVVVKVPEKPKEVPKKEPETKFEPKKK